ncbi:MAG: hypothetical protein IT452_12930 [Planctomycetia bacterium]|nr:hypothetical protein [Planctomycetia bacterium]
MNNIPPFRASTIRATVDAPLATQLPGRSVLVPPAIAQAPLSTPTARTGGGQSDDGLGREGSTVLPMFELPRLIGTIPILGQRPKPSLSAHHGLEDTSAEALIANGGVHVGIGPLPAPPLAMMPPLWDPCSGIDAVLDKLRYGTLQERRAAKFYMKVLMKICPRTVHDVLLAANPDPADETEFAEDLADLMAFDCILFMESYVELIDKLDKKENLSVGDEMEIWVVMNDLNKLKCFKGDEKLYMEDYHKFVDTDPAVGRALARSLAGLLKKRLERTKK